MPHRCAFGCQQTSTVMHSFPNPKRYPERFKAWVDLVGSKVEASSDNEIYKKYKICDIHFIFKHRNRCKRLNALAVPMLHLPAAPTCENIVELSLPTGPFVQSGLKIALIQLAVGKDKAKNVASAVSEIHKAKQQGAQLVALPEFFNAPYGTKYFKEYAEEIPCGTSSCALKYAAMEAGVCVVGGTMPERCGDDYYNTCVVWDPFGNMLAQHRKVHLFDIDIPGKITFKESDVLSAGDHITMFDYLGVKIGLGICYDLRFFEMAQVMSKEGCSVLMYPGAFNMTTGPRHWELLGRARANDLQLWVALISPARDTTAEYVAWGHSMLIDPWGSVVQQLDEKPGTLCADIDLRMVEDVRSQIPVRSQRRTDIYDTISHQ